MICEVAVAGGSDPASARVLAVLQRFAESRLTVLLTGPPGVGKTTLAEQIHRWSRRRGAFVLVDCPAIQATLFERELFGHERGAFTGADRPGPGLVEAAAGGTLFLEEVGDLAPENQARLLSFLGSSTYRRLGSTEVRRATVRVVAATNRDPRKALRPDLYDRLAQVEERVPALDERPLDLIPLAESLIARVAAEEGWRWRPLSVDARAALLARTWPGNVRELATAVHRALLEAERERAPNLRARHFGSPTVPWEGALARRVEEFERLVVADALRAEGWNVTAAARRLGVHRQRIHEIIRRWGLERPD